MYTPSQQLGVTLGVCTNKYSCRQLTSSQMPMVKGGINCIKSYSKWDGNVMNKDRSFFNFSKERKMVLIVAKLVHELKEACNNKNACECIKIFKTNFEMVPIWIGTGKRRLSEGTLSSFVSTALNLMIMTICWSFNNMSSNSLCWKLLSNKPILFQITL